MFVTSTLFLASAQMNKVQKYGWLIFDAVTQEPSWWNHLSWLAVSSLCSIWYDFKWTHQSHLSEVRAVCTHLIEIQMFISILLIDLSRLLWQIYCGRHSHYRFLWLKKWKCIEVDVVFAIKCPEAGGAQKSRRSGWFTFQLSFWDWTASFSMIYNVNFHGKSNIMNEDGRF